MKTFVSAAVLFCFCAGAVVAADQTHFQFAFDGGKPLDNKTHVSPSDIYSKPIGYGFEPGADVSLQDGGIGSDKPFYFSVKLPEGNYRVTLYYNNKTNESVLTVKAELRRLMLEKFEVHPKSEAARSFIVNIRTPEITGSDTVHLKPRERSTEMWDWDEKLTLEFNGSNPSVQRMDIEPANVPTIFLAGDSTVCDQPGEPWTSWGQMLPRFFKPEIAIANHAESGETVADFLRARRFDKIFSDMKRGDYLFVQFGHNDMKSKAPDALEKYKADLKAVVERTKTCGGIPVLVTSMERKAGVKTDTLGGYPDAVRAVAGEENCLLIDLHTMSKALYRSMGPDIDKAFQDGTHHNGYGSYEIAKCIVQAIKAERLPIARYIVPDFRDFSPLHPDPADEFSMPASPTAQAEKPLGS